MVSPFLFPCCRFLNLRERSGRGDIVTFERSEPGLGGYTQFLEAQAAIFPGKLPDFFQAPAQQALRADQIIFLVVIKTGRDLNDAL